MKLEMASRKMIGAVDIGGTKIAAGLVNESGTVLARAACATQAGRGPRDALARICETIDSMTARVGGETVGIGVGCTGPVDALSGVIGNVPFLPGWQGFDLAAELSAAFGVRVALENDADAAALGETAWGAGRDARRFVYVTVSTGIGGGLIFDSRLYRGANSSHPEVGHHIIDASGPLCSCGARGCWESLAGGLAFAERYNAATGEALDAREICKAAEGGQPRALEAVAREGYYLGLGLVNLITLFAPDVIALGGGVMQSQRLFWEEIYAVIRASCRLVPHDQVRIVPAALGLDAGLIGAACAWIHRFGDAS
jgi:glucokinase